MSGHPPAVIIFNDCVSARDNEQKSQRRDSLAWLIAGWLGEGMQPAGQYTYTHRLAKSPQGTNRWTDNPFRSFLLTWNAISLRANQSPIAFDEFLCLKNAQNLQRFMVIVNKAQNWHFNHFISAIFKLSCSCSFVALDGAASVPEGVLVSPKVWVRSCAEQQYEWISVSAHVIVEKSRTIWISFINNSYFVLHESTASPRAGRSNFLHFPCRFYTISSLKTVPE